MSVNSVALSVRAKKLGVLIRDARQAKKKTLEDCAQVVGVLPSTFESYEMGEQSPSLPELELLSFYLDVPIDHFWGNKALSQVEDGHLKPQILQLIPLRQRVIGALIRRARLGAGLSQEALAEKARVSASLLESYEMGEAPIPVPDLELISSILDCSLRDFRDQHGPVGAWAAQQKAVQDFLTLPPDLQAFVSKPVNRPYLELAERLSEMSVDKLRAVAEGLLEITL